MKGLTNLYVRYLRAGGRDAPSLVVETISTKEVVTIHVSINIAIEIGKYLDQELEISGEAEWAASATMELLAFTMTSYRVMPRFNPNDFAGKISHVSGFDWEAPGRESITEDETEAKDD